MSEPRSLKDAYEQLKAAEADKAEGEARAKAANLSARERRARTVARLAAVQALYQMEIAAAGVEAVVREFCDHRFDADLEGEQLAEADEAFFAEVVRGVVEHQQTIDRAIAHRLASGWRLERLDAVGLRRGFVDEPLFQQFADDGRNRAAAQARAVHDLDARNRLETADAVQHMEAVEFADELPIARADVGFCHAPVGRRSSRSRLRIRL